MTLRVALVAAALVATAAGGAAAREERAAHPCVRGNELWFRAADGTRLVGHRFGKGSTAVILAHQSDGDLCPWVPYARRLAAQGYFVFPFDFRGHGFSDDLWYPGRLGGDVAAAARAVRRLGKTKVLLVGASMGGIASLVAAANVRPAVDGVVSLSSPAQFESIDALRHAPRLRVPVLYVAARDDGGGRFASDAAALHRATASRDKRLELVAGPLHGIALLEGDRAVRKLVEDFLRKPG